MKNSKSRIVVLVLGDRPLASGIHPEHRDRCDRAVAFLVEYQKQMGNVPVMVILTGGVTLPGQVSEAELARQYCGEALRDFGAEVRLEDQATTTSSNLLFSKAIIERENVTVAQLVIVARRSQVLKTRLYARSFWPNLDVHFRRGIDLKPLWHKALDYSIMPFLAWVDPQDRFWRMLRRTLAKKKIW